MIIKRYSELASRGYPVGSAIWACAFDCTYSKEGMHLKQEPIYGMLVAGEKEIYHNNNVARGQTSPTHFVPFKKDGKSLAWSKAVKAHSRCYATSEEECRSLFNELIGQCISWHDKQIYELQQMLLKE